MKRLLSVLLPFLILLGGCGKGKPVPGKIWKHTEKDKNGKTFRESEFYLDKRGRKIGHGQATQYYDNAKVQFQGQMQHGKREGEWQEFYPNAAKKAVFDYKNGLLDGKFTVWYKTGQLKVSGQNVEGLQDGKWLYYDENGKVTREEFWDEGEKQDK